MIRTINQITVHEGQGTKLTKVTCNIAYVTSKPNGDIIVHYSYLDEDGNELPVKKPTFDVLSENRQSMYDSVKLGLPSPDTDHKGHEWGAYWAAAKIEMVKTFADLTNVSEIEEL